MEDAQVTTITEIPEEVLEKQADEFAKKGKGRPPRAVATKLKERRLQKKKDGSIVINDDAKLELFLEEFLKNDGNATQAALTVFNPTSIQSAATLGSYYLKRAKAKGLVRTLLEKKGYGHGKMLDEAIKKMQESKTPEWWDRLMKMADYEDFMTKKVGSGGPAIVNIVGAQRQQMQEFGFAEEGEFDDTAQNEEEGL